MQNLGAVRKKGRNKKAQKKNEERWAVIFGNDHEQSIEYLLIGWYGT